MSTETSSNLKVYDSARRRSPLLDELLTLVAYRELIRQFVARSLKTRYKRSMLGIVWTLLNPLLTMIVLTLVFSNMFRFNIPHYPVYILSGLMAWMFFSGTTHAAMSEMIWSSELLHRIYVPKSVFAVSAVGTGLVNLLISLVPLFLISLVIGQPIRLSVLVMPLAILLLVMFALGISLLLSTVIVYFADMSPVYDVILTIWMYATPIIYSIDIIPPEWQVFFKLNPMYHLIRLFRAPLFEGKFPPWHTWLIGGVVAVGALLLGSVVFTARSREYAYRV